MAGEERRARIESLWRASEAGDTPLHFAINNRDVEIITTLYKAGADVTIENDDGETAASLGARIGLNFD